VLPDSSKITGFWNVMPHRLVQMHQHFEEIYCPYLKNNGTCLPKYMMSYPRRP